MSKYKADDIDLLLPSFAILVRRVLQAMRDKGYDPVPFDTLRTQKEADKFAARGVGSARSMHLYGAACDVICGAHGWDCGRHRCKFFETYGDVVESLGLTWGGNFDRDRKRRDRKYDAPHMQACTVGEQDAVRAIADWAERDRYVSRLMSDRLLAL